TVLALPVLAWVPAFITRRARFTVDGDPIPSFDTFFPPDADPLARLTDFEGRWQMMPLVVESLTTTDGARSPAHRTLVARVTPSARGGFYATIEAAGPSRPRVNRPGTEPIPLDHKCVPPQWVHIQTIAIDPESQRITLTVDHNGEEIDLLT